MSAEEQHHRRGGPAEEAPGGAQLVGAEARHRGAEGQAAPNEDGGGRRRGEGREGGVVQALPPRHGLAQQVAHVPPPLAIVARATAATGARTRARARAGRAGRARARREEALVDGLVDDVHAVVDGEEVVELGPAVRVLGPHHDQAAARRVRERPRRSESPHSVREPSFGADDEVVRRRRLWLWQWRWSGCIAAMRG